MNSKIDELIKNIEAFPNMGQATGKEYYRTVSSLSARAFINACRLNTSRNLEIYLHQYPGLS